MWNNWNLHQDCSWRFTHQHRVLSWKYSISTHTTSKRFEKLCRTYPHRKNIMQALVYHGSSGETFVKQSSIRWPASHATCHIYERFWQQQVLVVRPIILPAAKKMTHRYQTERLLCPKAQPLRKWRNQSTAILVSKRLLRMKTFWKKWSNWWWPWSSKPLNGSSAAWEFVQNLPLQKRSKPIRNQPKMRVIDLINPLSR